MMEICVAIHPIRIPRSTIHWLGPSDLLLQLSTVQRPAISSASPGPPAVLQQVHPPRKQMEQVGCPRYRKADKTLRLGIHGKELGKTQYQANEL